MDTEADISDRISPMKLEVEDKEHNSGNSKIALQELIGVAEKVDPSFVSPLETINSSASRENMQVENVTDIADVHAVNECIIKSIEGENFLKSPSGFDVEVDKNTEENQLNSLEKISGSQNGDHIDMKTDENNAIPVSETTDCSKSTTLDIKKLRDVCSLEEKRDNNLTTEAMLSQQDSTETSFKGEDGSQNKISQSLLTEKEEDEVDKIEISKQESDHAAKDIAEDNLKDKPEALMTEYEQEKLDTIVNEERDLKETPEHEEPVELEQSFMHKNESATENDEMLVTDASEEIETTPPRETPDQIPEKESEMTTSGENKLLAIPEEKNLAAINLDEKNEAAEVAVTNKSGDDSDATSPLEEEEVQIISEKLNQVSKPETESQVLEVEEGPEGEQEGNLSNEVIQTEKHFDKIAGDQIIKEEEFEEPNVTNKREKIEEDEKNETLPEHATEFNREDMISYSQGNETDTKIGDEEEPNELPEGPGNKIENDIEKSEDVSSLVTQALTEEIYDEKKEDTKNCVDKANIAPQRFAETTSLTEVEPIDKHLEEASIMNHLSEHEIEKGDREKVEHPDAKSESNVQAVQDVYEIPRSTNVEEHGAFEIEKIIREVPEEPYETSDQCAEADKNVEISSHQTIQAEETEHQLPASSSIFLSSEEDGESETKTQMEDKTGYEGSDAVSETKDRKIEEMHETKTSTSAERNEEGSETNEDSEPTMKPSFHGIEEIKEIQSPIAGHIPADEEKEELSPVPETGNSVNKLENEITDKTETEVSKPDANEVREENISEIEPKVQSVDTIVEAESNPPAGETQAGKRNEEMKDVPEKVSEPKAQNVEEVSKTSIDVRSSKEDQFEKLNREAPDVFSKSTNQVVEAARNDDTVTPTVATEVISSKEFQLNDEPENVTDSVSSAESTETDEKADSSLLDEGTEKNVLEDASAAASDYGHEDEEKESESAEFHDKVEEARTPVTVSEYKDQVVEDARDTDLISAGDESNINEISKVNQEVPEKLPVAINEDVEAGSKVSPDQKIMKSDAEEVQEAKASEASIQSKAISVQEIDGFDPTPVVDKTRVNEEKEETEAVLESDPGINFQGVDIPNQTLPIESKEKYMEPCSTLIEDQHHETTTEVEIVKSESIHKNDTRLNVDMAVLLETDTTQNVVHRELEISNSDVTNQDTQNVATEKEIDEESIEEKTTCNEGTNIALRTGTEASLLGERELINDHINAFDTSLETTIPKTNETVGISKQDSKVDDTKLEENSNVKSQLLSHENVSEACESKAAEKADAENLEAENSEVPAAESETTVHSVEENHETDTSQALGYTDASEEIDGFHPTPVVGKTPINEAKEETEAVIESVPEINFQGVGTIIDEEVSTSQTLPYENREQLTEPCSTLVEDPHHETATEVEMVKDGSINKNNTLLNEDTDDTSKQDSQVDDTKLEENSNVKSQLLSHENVSEACESKAAEMADAENLEDENLEVPAAESETSVHSVEENHETDTSQALGDTDASEEIDGFHPTPVVGKTPINEAKEETEAVLESVPEINFQGVRTIIDEEVSTSQTLPYENREQLTEPCSTLVEDPHHETATEVEMVKDGSINKNNTLLNEDTDDTSNQDSQVDDTKLEENSNVKSQLLSHENVSEACESKAAEKADAENLEAENSEVPAAESETSVHSVEENHETDTSQALGDTDASEEIDGFHPTPVVGKTSINEAKEETEGVLESVPEINFQGVGTIIDEEVSTSQTLPYENREQLTEPCSTLVEDPHHETATEVEMVKAGSINKNNTLLNEDTDDTSKQDSQVDDTKLEENSNVKSQLLSHENVSEACESKAAEMADAENLEDENLEVPAAESETSVHSVEENHETDTSQALGDTDTSEEIDGFHPTPVVGKTPINEAKEETEAVLESVPEINFQGVGTIIDDEVSTSQTLPYENKEQLTEPCSTLVEDPHHETATEVEMVKAGSINKNNTLLNEDTDDSFETCTAGNVVPTELENSYLIVEDTENKATKECDEETDIAATTETEVTLLGESELIIDPINTSGTTSETTPPETIETIDTSEVDDIKLEEISIVESQLLAYENETEVCKSIIAKKTDAENVEVEKSEVPSAESEPLVRNVEEIQETDTSPSVRETNTSEIEEGIREVSGLTSQVYEADSSNEIAHGQKIQAENKIEQVPVPSFVFLSSEESPESEAITIQNKEDGQMKKEDIEENNLKPQEDSGMVSQLQNIETVEETEADVIEFEESTGFGICESRTLLEEIQETQASPNAKNSGTDEREKETKSLAENVSASSTLNVEAVIVDEDNERPLAIEESEEEHQESSTAILSKNKDETEESPETKTSNLLGVEEVHETETTADVEKTCADEVEEETKEALRAIPEECQDAGTIINREVLFNQNFPLEAIKSSKDGVEETDMAPIHASEVTDIGEIEVSEEAEKDLDISSDSKTPEAVETVDTCQRDSEVEIIKTEKASIVESKPAEHENNKEAHGSITGEKTDAYDVEVDNQKLLDAESNSSSVDGIHGAKGDLVVRETDTNKSEKVVEEKPKALPRDIIQETSGMLSQVQNIETTKTSDADEVEAEEAKSFDAIYESKDHFDETLDTKTSRSAEISYEVKMEEATNNVAEKISDVETLSDDVPADESTSVSKCPTENADIGANIKKSAAAEPEAIVSELITESRVLDVEEIHETETSPTVGKIHTDGEEDKTKTVLETTYEPDHEDAADIIARYIISNQPFPHQNKEDIKNGVEETDILPAVVTEEGSMGENNPIDKVVKASGHSSDNETIQTADITKLDSEIPHETEKISHQGIIQTVQEIHDINSTSTVGENDANGSVNVTDVEEAKRISSVVKLKDQAVEDICETGTSPTVGEAGTDGSDQEIRDAPQTITEKINQDAAEVSKEEITLNQPIEAEKTKEQKDNGFDPIPESKDWIFEEARDTKTIPAAEIADKNKKEEYSTKVLEKISDDICTSDEAIVDGQTQSGTVFEPIYQAVGESINKDINPNTIVQNECKKQLNEPCTGLLKDQDQETFVKDGMIKAEGSDKNSASLNENAIDSSEAGTIVEKSSSKPVDKKYKEAFDLEFEKLGEVLQPESEILVSEVYSAPKVTDNVDGQLEEPAGNMRGYESETHIENTTEASQAIHEITSKEPLTEEPEKTNNILKEPITADNNNIETPEQVSIGTRTAKVNYAEEEKNGTYVENEPITENEGKESEKLATESIRSIKEVKSLEVTLGKPEDKLGDYNEKDKTVITNINNLENHVEKEKIENESHVPPCEKSSTKESVSIEEQEATANASDFPSSKTTSDEELADEGEIMVDQKQPNFVPDPLSIIPRTEEQVEMSVHRQRNLVTVPTANNQEVIRDVTETNEIVKEPQEQEKIFLSQSQAQIARKEYPNEEKENTTAIANRDFQVITEDPTAAKQVECFEEGKQGEGTLETIEKMTQNDQTKQVSEEPKTEAEERALVEEEKTEEEEEEHKKADSGSDAPVMVEAPRDIDVKTPQKKSHNILSGVGSKVKHSIAKVKKAITGKSSHQKASSPKEDKKTETVPLL